MPGPMSGSTLLIHGRCDLLVPHQQSIAYHEALQALGVRSQLHLIDGADHCFFGADIDAIIATTVTFLSDELAPEPGASPADAASRNCQDLWIKIFCATRTSSLPARGAELVGHPRTWGL